MSPTSRERLKIHLFKHIRWRVRVISQFGDHFIICLIEYWIDKEFFLKVFFSSRNFTFDLFALYTLICKARIYERKFLVKLGKGSSRKWGKYITETDLLNARTWLCWLRTFLRFFDFVGPISELFVPTLSVLTVVSLEPSFHYSLGQSFIP